jgi:peptide/nickel transport system permease protein
MRAVSAAPLPRPVRALTLKLNPPLVCGALLVALLLGCSLAAPLLAPHDPFTSIILRVDGRILATPYPPGTPGMPLGSDRAARDMLSRLLYGSRYTLLLACTAALLRLLIGAALGLIGGWYNKSSRAIDVLVGVSSALPSLFFALLPILLINRLGNQRYEVVSFLIALSLTGWAETALRCRTAVQSLRSAAFVEAAHAIGLRRSAILLRHVLPNLRDLLLVEAAYAIAAVLLLIAELGFLNVVVGGATSDVVGSRVIASDPIYAEWGSMLARGLRQRSFFWLFLEPLLAFTLVIMGFNLLAEGLRRR